MENLQGGTLALEHRYDVLERTGRHGFVTLYHGRQDPFAKRVWVKAYDGLAGAGAGIELFDRLKETGKRVSRLDADGVLRIVDYGELEGGIPFVISERCEGVSLSEILIREGTLSAEATASLLGRLASVLEAAHHQGITHGSLSPRWIYVDRDRFDEAMIDHFQLAVTVGEILAAENAVMSAEAVSAYPPEMFIDADQLIENDQQGTSVSFEPAGDVWSLGVLAYTAMVGVHPFFEEELDASEGILRLRNEQARPLSEMGVDVQISEVVERALAKDPADRFGSVTELAAAFEAAVGPKEPLEREPKSASSSKVAPDPGQNDGEDRASSRPNPSHTGPSHTGPSHTGPSLTEPSLSETAQSTRSLDAPDQREPGPSDRLLTSVIVLLFLTNLAWLFYVTGSVDEPSNPNANKPTPTSVVTDR